MFYPPDAKERALALRESLEAAHVWYKNQLNVQVPMAPVKILQANGQTDTVPARSWSRYVIAVGAAIKLSDATCLTGREDPSLALIEKQN